MFTISAQQMEMFKKTAWLNLVSNFTDRLVNDFPIMKQCIGQKNLRQAGDDNANIACEKYNFEAPHHIESYVRYCLSITSFNKGALGVCL